MTESQPRLTIQMDLEERRKLKQFAVRLCAEGKLEAPTIAALVRVAIQRYLTDELALLERAEAALGKETE